MRRSIRRVAAFTLATVLAVSTLTIGGDVTTVNAASSKVNVITAEKNNGGDTIKYTYNKKGLVSKIVSKNSYRTADEDVSETVTTTYKYNKKNKIAKKTTKRVTKKKSYETDKTTNLKIVGTKGTVTETSTTATTYKYNKKGLATSSVATTTRGKSGSKKTQNKSFLINDDDGYYDIELSDGRVIAGYNGRKSDGTYYEDTEKAQSAYYYSGNLALTEGTTDTITTYANKGNGIYIETITTTTNRAGYRLEPVKAYYKYANGSVVELKKGDFQDADGKHYTYQKPDGTYTDDYDFSITQQVNIVQDPTASHTSKDVSTTEANSKTVITTKYSYDKKKRVKKAVATTVSSGNTSGSRSSSESSTYSGNDGEEYSVTSVSSYTDKDKSTYENTAVTTTTYTYDKKGHAKKTVSTNTGKENRKRVYASMNAENSRETTKTYKSGKTTTKKDSSSINTYPTTTTQTVVNGVQTTTKTDNPYIETYSHSSSGTDNYSKEGKKETVTYANGGRIITETYTQTNTGNTMTGTEIDYRFDEKGKSGGSVFTYKNTDSTGTTHDGNSAEYWGPNEYVDGVAATQKIDAAKGALVASGTPFNKSTTKTVLATPSKTTTTYSYDKKGNVKAETTNGTRTVINNVINETYGNTIYEFDANGDLQPKQKAVTHKYTEKNTYENTVKNGTNRLTKVLSMRKYTQDRTKSNAYNLSGRVTYTVKSKKSSAAKLAKKQQWILQNGRLNGEIGLD